MFFLGSLAQNMLMEKIQKDGPKNIPLTGAEGKRKSLRGILLEIYHGVEWAL
jgi:hypothetical protein